MQIKKHSWINWYYLAVLAIFLLTIFLRFYNYPNRWGLASDQARDAIIIEKSIQLHSLPFIGPFSASGPFVFGSSWYIIFIFFTAILPNSVLTPWIIQGIFFCLIVLLMIHIGRKIEGKSLGLLAGLFTALSTSQVILSTNLIFSALVSVISVICLYFFIKAINEKNNYFLSILGYFIGLAITIHFQAIPLFLLLIIVFCAKRKWSSVIFALWGFILPFIPLIVFDIETNFHESSSLIKYFFSANTAPITVRWLTYAGIFWPKVWADIIGGYTPIGYLIIICTILTSTIFLIKKKIPQTMVYVLLGFLGIVVILRYFQGTLFENFLSFLHPFVILITAWICLQIVKYNKYLGIGLITIIVVLSFIASFTAITNAQNHTKDETILLQSFIEKKYPNKKFAIYDYQYGNTAQSLPLSLFLFIKRETGPSGIRIGITNQGSMSPLYPLLYHIDLPYGINVYDLNGATPGDLARDKWILVNPRAVFNSMQDWYKEE